MVELVEHFGGRTGCPGGPRTIPRSLAAPLIPNGHWSLPVLTIEGTGSSAGSAYGAAATEVIGRHLALLHDHLGRETGLSERQAYVRARSLRATIRETAPWLASEIDGIADGAGITTEAAWLLQLSCEIIDPNASGFTAVAVEPYRSREGGMLVGANVDLPRGYHDLLVLIRRTVRGHPAVLAVAPAGHVGLLGLNTDGVAVIAGSIVHGPTDVGAGGSIWARLALEERRGEDALRRIEQAGGSSSCVVVADRTSAVAIGTETDEPGRVRPCEGLLVRTDQNGTMPPTRHGTGWGQRYRADLRRARATELLRARREISIDDVAAVLRDRAYAPHAICHRAHDLPIDTETVLSTILDVAGRRIWVCAGSPDVATYVAHDTATLQASSAGEA